MSNDSDDIELPEKALDAAVEVHFTDLYTVPWKDYKHSDTGDKFKKRTAKIIQAFLKGL